MAYTTEDFDKMIQYGETPPLSNEDAEQLIAHLDKHYSNIRTIAIDGIGESVLHDDPVEIQFGHDPKEPL